MQKTESAPRYMVSMKKSFSRKFSQSFGAEVSAGALPMHSAAGKRPTSCSKRTGGGTPCCGPGSCSGTAVQGFCFFVSMFLRLTRNDQEKTCKSCERRLAVLWVIQLTLVEEYFGSWGNGVCGWACLADSQIGRFWPAVSPSPSLFFLLPLSPLSVFLNLFVRLPASLDTACPDASLPTSRNFPPNTFQKYAWYLTSSDITYRYTYGSYGCFAQYLLMNSCKMSFHSGAIFSQRFFRFQLRKTCAYFCIGWLYAWLRGNQCWPWPPIQKQ